MSIYKLVKQKKISNFKFRLVVSYTYIKTQCLILCLLIIIVPLWGQKTYKLIPSTSNKILIKGTSNLHDWESNVGQVNGDMSATLDGNTLTKIEKVSVKITVNSIKSGKGLMDSKTMDALKNEKFPYIIFQSSAVTISGKNNLSAVGQLSIAGVSQTKTIPVTYKISNDGSITIKGEAKIKMSDYAIKPPTAMMGMLTTGNDTDITFEVLFKP